MVAKAEVGRPAFGTVRLVWCALRFCQALSASHPCKRTGLERINLMVRRLCLVFSVLCSVACGTSQSAEPIEPIEPGASPVGSGSDAPTEPEAAESTAGLAVANLADDYCEQAEQEGREALRALQQQGIEVSEDFDHDFAQKCRQAPEDAQQCLVPSYAFVHVRECHAIRQRPDWPY